MSDKPTIFLGMPFYHGSIEMESVVAALTSCGDDFRVKFAPHGGSNIGKGFNTLWANALNYHRDNEAQYFAMLHGDVVPKGDWLQNLFNELHANKLDCISVVSPIKSSQGVTSTGCDIADGDPWRVRRFTMTEIMRLPETFTHADTVESGLNPLGTPFLVNTGCMLIDLKNPAWLEKEKNGDLRFHFTLHDRIREDEDGDLMAHSISEDWDWSRMMHARGLRYAATRKIAITHMGRKGYSNSYAWGAWKYDRAHPELVACSEEGTPLAAVCGNDMEAVE